MVQYISGFSFSKCDELHIEKENVKFISYSMHYSTSINLHVYLDISTYIPDFRCTDLSFHTHELSLLSTGTLVCSV